MDDDLVALPYSVREEAFGGEYGWQNWIHASLAGVVHYELFDLRKKAHIPGDPLSSKALLFGYGKVASDSVGPIYRLNVTGFSDCANEVSHRFTMDQEEAFKMVGQALGDLVLAVVARGSGSRIEIPDMPPECS
ncbi:hypothetical protein IPL68_05230 [Candidatus Saccharibacteria bacterium]|nr:MAG: hypothetical protein IPL68_05230 [Candidatus Saccharibacteria bacterium]